MVIYVQVYMYLRITVISAFAVAHIFSPFSRIKTIFNKKTSMRRPQTIMINETTLIVSDYHI